MKFIESFKKSKRSVKIGTVAGLLLMLSIPVFFIAFPHILNKQWLIEVIYLPDNQHPRVVTFYQEIGNSDDGNYINGYWVYLHDPTQQKPIDKIFLDRSERDIPPYPQINTFGDEIWVTSIPGFASSEKPYFKIIKISNDQLSILPTDFLKDWSFQNVMNDSVLIINKYSEQGCLDPITKKISNTPCHYPNDKIADTTNKNMFFLVKNTGTSVRSKLYYYSSDKTFEPAGVFAGFTSPDGVIPGWHLPDAVKMSYGSLDPKEFESYKSKFEPSESVVLVQETLFSSPFILFQNDSICIISSIGDDEKSVYFQQFTAGGKLKWKTLCPTLKTNTFASTMRVHFSKSETILIHPQNWVLCIDNSNGSIKWQCPK